MSVVLARCPRCHGQCAGQDSTGGEITCLLCGTVLREAPNPRATDMHRAAANAAVIADIRAQPRPGRPPKALSPAALKISVKVAAAWERGDYVGMARRENAWTPEQDALLRKLLASRTPIIRAIERMVARFGVARTAAAVRQRASRLGLSKAGSDWHRPHTKAAPAASTSPDSSNGIKTAVGPLRGLSARQEAAS